MSGRWCGGGEVLISLGKAPWTASVFFLCAAEPTAEPSSGGMATKPSTTRRWGEKTKDGVRQIRTATILSHGRGDAVDRGRDALMVRFVDISLTADAYVNTAAGKEGLEREAVVPGHHCR